MKKEIFYCLEDLRYLTLGLHFRKYTRAFSFHFWPFVEFLFWWQKLLRILDTVFWVPHKVFCGIWPVCDWPGSHFWKSWTAFSLSSFSAWKTREKPFTIYGKIVAEIFFLIANCAHFFNLPLPISTIASWYSTATENPSQESVSELWRICGLLFILAFVCISFFPYELLCVWAFSRAELLFMWISVYVNFWLERDLFL